MEKERLILKVMSIALIICAAVSLVMTFFAIPDAAARLASDAPAEVWRELGLDAGRYSDGDYAAMKNIVRRGVYVVLVFSMLVNAFKIWIGIRGVRKSAAISVSNGRFFMLWGLVFLVVSLLGIRNIIMGIYTINIGDIIMVGAHLIISVAYFFLGRKLRYGY